MLMSANNAGIKGSVDPDDIVILIFLGLDGL
jgi:hypothetical protein